MKLRPVTAALTVVLACAGLTACSSKVGVAAVVGGHRITESTVSGYVAPAGPTVASTSPAASSVPPKVQILETLIQNDIFMAALAFTTGGAPDAAVLAQAHDAAVENVLELQSGGAAADKSLNTELVSLGYKPGFTAIVVRSAELQYLLITRIKATTSAQVHAAILRAHQSVQVSQRYGTWDPTTLAITTTNGAGLPSFVKLNPLSK